MIINSFYENKKTTKRDLKNILGKYNFSAYNKIKNNILAIKLYFFFFFFVFVKKLNSYFEYFN